MSNWGLKSEDIKKIKSVLEKYPNISKVIIYGSRAMGTQRDGSDIDLTLQGDQLSLEDLNSIAIELDDLLLPFIFDISIYRHIKNKDLINHIQLIGKEFYSPNCSITSL